MRSFDCEFKFNDLPECSARFSSISMQSQWYLRSKIMLFFVVFAMIQLNFNIFVKVSLCFSEFYINANFCLSRPVQQQVQTRFSFAVFLKSRWLYKKILIWRRYKDIFLYGELDIRTPNQIFFFRYEIQTGAHFSWYVICMNTTFRNHPKCNKRTFPERRNTRKPLSATISNAKMQKPQILKQCNIAEVVKVQLHNM